MTLVVGSYVKLIWGFALHPETQTLAPLFSYPSHTTPIKSAAASGPLAATGASDNAIKVCDLPSSEVGSLLDQFAPVTALAAFSSPLGPSLPRNLFVAADGDLFIYDADPFVHLHTVAVHCKGLNGLDVHPSGRLAPTVGRDSCLAMVNLIRRRRSFSCRLSKEAEIVRYSHDGGKFFMVSEEKIGVHEAEDAKLVCEMETSKRVLCVAIGESGFLFTGGEDRNITTWDSTSGKVAHCIENAHSGRVKGLVVFRNKHGQTSETPNILASASSDDVIRVWDVRMIAKEKPIPLSEANTKSRQTSLAGSSVKQNFKAASKRMVDIEDIMSRGKYKLLFSLRGGESSRRSGGVYSRSHCSIPSGRQDSVHFGGSLAVGASSSRMTGLSYPSLHEGDSEVVAADAMGLIRNCS